MLNYSVRRVALTAVSLVVAGGLVFVTSGCGARPTANAGEPVIIAQTAPSRPTTTSSTPSQSVSATAEPPATSPVDSPGGAQPIDPAPLEQAARAIEPNTTLGAVVLDLATNEELLAVNADRQFSSASLVKLMIAIDALNQGATASQRQQIARMLSMSDDDIASALWVQDGGSMIIERVTTLIGLQHTDPPEQSGKWGEVKLTAHDMLLVYEYIVKGLSAEDHTLIVDAMAQAPRVAADGFDQYFGIPDGLNLQWAIKQGWGNNSRTMVLHSTGLVGAKSYQYIVILLTEHPLGSGWSTSTKAVTAVAAALKGQLPPG